MLPIGVGRETCLGKGGNLEYVLLADSMIADGMAEVGDVIEVEITELVLYNRVKLFIFVKREDDDVFSYVHLLFLAQVHANVVHRVIEDRFDGLQVFFFPFFIYNNVAIMSKRSMIVFW